MAVIPDRVIGGWVTINGAHILLGEEGSKGSSSGYKSARQELDMVRARLAEGHLKSGERKMLERRQERLSGQLLTEQEKKK